MEKEKIVSLLNRTVRLHGFNRLYVLQKYIAYRDSKTGRLEHCVQLSEKNNPNNVLQIGIEKVQLSEDGAESVTLPAELKDELTENKEFIIKHFNRVVRVGTPVEGNEYITGSCKYRNEPIVRVLNLG